MEILKWSARVLGIVMMAFNMPSEGRAETHIAWLEISRVNFDMTAIVKVECDEFTKIFKEGIETFVLVDRSAIETFYEILKGLTPRRGSSPDVRAKVSVRYREGKTDTLCIGHTGISLNGMPMTPAEKMVRFIEDARPPAR